MQLAETLASAPTPCLVLDRARFEGNCERMRQRARALGVGLRPHMKTLKSIEAAHRAVDPAHGGIAVSTLQEAAYFADAGLTDIQLALCITADKLDRAADILRRAERFSFFLDSVTTAEAVRDHAKRTGTPFRVWIEIDTGGGRTGVGPDEPRLLQIAGALAGGNVVLEGVATHAGHSYHAADREEIAAIAEAERHGVVRAAEVLRAAGFACPGVSAGSTPTATHLARADGLTEIRPGVYMAGDVFQAAVGSLSHDDIALSVVATVMSHSGAGDQIVVDAGGLALSKDRSTHELGEDDVGYGLVVDLDGSPLPGAPVIGDVHQEHGQIFPQSPALFERLPIGAKVRILPNHACMTAAAYGEYLVAEGARVTARWGRTNGW